MNKTEILCASCKMNSTLNVCFFQFFKKISKCPCTECLVKMMCERSCEKRELCKKEILDEP
jgi:hypothetical protein